MNSQEDCIKYGADSVDYVSSTKMDLDTFSFQWTIHNFSSHSLEHELSSPKYVGGQKTKHVWSLGVVETKPDGKDKNKYFWLNLRLCTEDSDDHITLCKPVKASFRVSILDLGDKPVFHIGKQADFDVYVPSSSEWGWNLFPMERLFNPQPQQTRYIYDDVMKIHCKIWIQCGVQNIIKNSSEWMQLEYTSTQKLGQDFKMGLVESAFSDMFVVTPTKTFQAHKFIMSSRSHVFKTMFASSMLESTQNSVNIPDFEEDIVHAMLEYMYSGQTLITSNNAIDLFRIADKYELMDLKNECELALGNDLKIENACEVLLIAHLHNAQQLVAKVMAFMNLNKKEIIKTEGFKGLRKADPLLLQELYMSTATDM